MGLFSAFLILGVGDLQAITSDSQDIACPLVLNIQISVASSAQLSAQAEETSPAAVLFFLTPLRKELTLLGQENSVVRK